MKRLVIRLEYESRTVHEIGSWEITDEILIGRSRECAWRTGKNDAVVSSQHAALYKHRGAVWVRDLDSKNGVFCRGRRIKKRRLKVGDHIGIGSHMLFVQAEKRAETDVLSEVVVLTGKARARKAVITPPAIVLGSDPECSLILMDSLISRKHAEISVKDDGSCWIRDMGSKNGTSVNELPLRDDKERLLKDGDRIGIAHLELEFHDGKAKRTSSQAWLRLGIMAATLVIALGLYRTYKRLRPSAEEYVNSARQLARARNFVGAGDELDKALSARNAEDHEVAIQELRGLLSLWRSTLMRWELARESLGKSNWVEASRNLGMLQAEKKEAWTWNDKALGEKEKAAQAKIMLDALLHASSAVRREDASASDLEADYKNVRTALSSTASGIPDYLQKLQFALEEMESKLRALIAQSRGLEGALDRLKVSHPPYPEVVAAVEKVGKDSEGALQRRATMVLEPIKALAVTFERLNLIADHIRNMEFQKIRGIKPDLPSADACSIDPRISQARINLEKIFGILKDKAAQVEYLNKETRQYMTRDGDAPGLTALESDAVMARVFACDSLDGTFPKRTRQKPAGDYDRVLGIDEFFTRLRTLPEPVDPIIASQWPFKSLLGQSRELLEKIDQMEKFFDGEKNRWLLGGKIAAELKLLNAISTRRDALVKKMAGLAGEETGRRALIAGGIAMHLATGDKKPQVDGKDVDKWLQAELKKNRAEVFELNSRFNTAPLRKQIEIRRQVLTVGLPGDPIVRRMWVMRSAVKRD